MKRKSILIIIFALGIFSSKIFAQNKAECEKIVIAAVEAINSKSPEQIEKFLAPDFTFSGQKAPLASLVLNQLVKQLNDKVSDYKKISESENDSELTFVYEFTYVQKLGLNVKT